MSIQGKVKLFLDFADKSVVNVKFYTKNFSLTNFGK